MMFCKASYKEEIELEEERNRVAIGILLDADVLERCPWHGNILDNLGDVVEAYKIAAARFKKRQQNYNADYADAMDCFDLQKDLTDTIKYVYEEDNTYPLKCPRCEDLDHE